MFSASLGKLMSLGGGKKGPAAPPASSDSIAAAEPTRPVVVGNNSVQQEKSDPSPDSPQNSSHSKNVSNKESNMLTLKVEVLLSLLAVKDAELLTAQNKIEALTWVVTNRQQSTDAAPLPPSPIADLDESRVELIQAMSKIAKAFSAAESALISAFADNRTATLPAAISRDTFLSALTGACPSLTAREVALLAMRFTEVGGSLVCVLEFLQFFSVSPQQRHAKLAKALLRHECPLLNLSDRLLLNLLPAQQSKRSPLTLSITICPLGPRQRRKLKPPLQHQAQSPSLPRKLFKHRRCQLSLLQSQKR
jgi:hypothetical protein